MSIVRINVLDVPPERAEMMAERFAQRAGEIEKVDGFEGFELLRPTDDSTRWFVYTRWVDEDSFEAWRSSESFGKGHAQSSAQGPVASGSELLGFDVVVDVTAERS